MKTHRGFLIFKIKHILYKKDMNFSAQSKILIMKKVNLFENE